jgi:hypothetical protein
MSFSRKQQGIYRPLVDAAWAREAPALGLLPADRPAWYRGHLSALFGVETTKALSPTSDFEIACAHFETLADDGTHWAQRLSTGHTRRLLHLVRRHCGGHADPVSYLRGIAAQAWHTTPDEIDLERLTPHQLHLLLLATIYHHRRHPEAGTPHPLPEELAHMISP